MGGDGGSIPSRIDQVRTRKKDQRLERDLENQIKWKMCALTQQRLKQPVVCCELGRLYNKESLLEAVIDKKLSQNVLTQHLRSFKDVKEIKLTVNPAFAEKADKGGDYKDNNASEFICPLTGLEMNGMYRFVLLWSCGCVMSEKAIKELKGNKCHSCAAQFDEVDDVVVLNPTADEMPGQVVQMNERRARVKAARKSKKATDPVKTEPTTFTAAAAAQHTTNKKLKRPKKEEIADGEAVAGGSSKAKKTAIQSDPKTTELYKSLFTSSEGAKRREGKMKSQLCATFNPAYF